MKKKNCVAAKISVANVLSSVEMEKENVNKASNVSRIQFVDSSCKTRKSS
jgi:hypothetical protein